MNRFGTFSALLVVLIIIAGVVVTTPNLLSQQGLRAWPAWLPNKTVSLGLDLQGGAHLLLEVALEDIRKKVLEDVQASAREVLRENDLPRLQVRLSGETNAVITAPSDETAAEIARALRTGLAYQGTATTEGSIITFTVAEEEFFEAEQAALVKAIDIIRLRVDETGTKEPVVQQQGRNRILVQLPGIDDPERVKQIIGRTAQMTFHLVNEEWYRQGAQGTVPFDTMLLPYADARAFDPDVVPPRLAVFRRIELGGDMLMNASAGFYENQPIVNFRFNTAGAKRFGRITAENTNRRFAIVLDNQVISAPVIDEPIAGGSGFIRGNFSVEEARDLALLLRSGALPAKMTFVEERTIGPGLGADSIAAGKLASIVALALVIITMILLYGSFGIMAVLGLLINLLLLLALLTGLQATLTLPGIAGIVLTLGMAVDSNILIFERMRDEIRHGQLVINAIDNGYRRALSTILDSNLTTLIAAGLLYAFGTGPVKGFAVTLALGLITSMFSALMVTRLFIVVWLRTRSRRPATLPIS